MKRIFSLALVIFASLVTLSAPGGNRGPRPSTPPVVPASNLVEDGYIQYELAELPDDYVNLTADRVIEVVERYPNKELGQTLGLMFRRGDLPIIVLNQPQRPAEQGAFPGAISYEEVNGSLRRVFKVNPRVFLNPRVPIDILWRTFAHESTHLAQYSWGSLPILPPGVKREYTPEEAKRYFEVECQAFLTECRETVEHRWPAVTDVDRAYRGGGESAMRQAIAAQYCDIGWHPVHCELFKRQALEKPH